MYSLTKKRKQRPMEEYPSLVEGTGLENREAAQATQGFESLFLRHFLKIYIIAGW